MSVLNITNIKDLFDPIGNQIGEKLYEVGKITQEMFDKEQTLGKNASDMTPDQAFNERIKIYLPELEEEVLKELDLRVKVAIIKYINDEIFAGFKENKKNA